MAAFYVVVHHARYLLLESQDSYDILKSRYTWLYRAFYESFSSFQFGHAAVMLFFVLSGFVIHLRYARQMARGHVKVRWYAYFWRRFFRIYPPFLFCLALTWACASTGLWVRDTSGLEWNQMGFARYYTTENMTLSTLLGNIVFLMDGPVKIYGFNGPLWSLKLEWWIYMVYPLLLIVSRRSLLTATLIVSALFYEGAFTHWIPSSSVQDLFAIMGVWWLGVLLAEVYVQRVKIGWLWVIGGCGLLGTTAWWLERTDLAEGCLFAAAFALLFFVQRLGLKLTFIEWFKPIGDFSYTLYVTHYPVLVLVSAVYSVGLRYIDLPNTPWLLICGVSLALGVAYGAHLFAERPFLSKKRRRSPFVRLNPAYWLASVHGSPHHPRIPAPTR